MDTDGLPELLVHSAILVGIVFVAVGLLNVFADPNFWFELAVAGFVVLAYRPIVFALGVAPDRWNEE